jgi:hypothetical protein
MVYEPEGRFFEKDFEEFLDQQNPPKRDELDCLIDYKFRTMQAYLKDSAKLSLSGVPNFLYMDVGLWAGDGQVNESRYYHERHRDFGVVCGGLAVLCKYPTPPDIAKTANVDNVDPNIRERDEYARVKPLLDYLSTDPQLGRVVVTKALMCIDTTWLFNAPINREIIHVFLGDLHVPVMTERKRTFLGEIDQEIDQEYHPTVPDDLVPRRLRLMPTELTDTMEKAKNSLDEIKKRFDKGEKEIEVADLLEVGGFLDSMDKFKLPPWEKQDEPVKYYSAGEWFTYYHDGARRFGDFERQKPADIFQHAGDDLIRWIDLLVKYNTPETPLRLVQTGDMYELWIGLKYGLHDKVMVPWAREYFNFWINETRRTKGLYCSSQAAAVEALESAGERGLPTTLLYGNHDNYRRYLEYNNSMYECNVTPPCRVIAEHGHATDSFNCDDNPEDGWKMTQMAFTLPMSRDNQKALTTAMLKTFYHAWWIKTMLPDRLLWVARAADLCLQDKCLVYVMGHSHESCLMRINIKPGIPLHY